MIKWPLFVRRIGLEQEKIHNIYLSVIKKTSKKIYQLVPNEKEKQYKNYQLSKNEFRLKLSRLVIFDVMFSL